MTRRVASQRAAVQPPTTALFDGLPVAQFLAQFWQREALLVRGAAPEVRDLLDAPQLFALAARDDVESRLVLRQRGKWSLQDGPFAARELKSLPKRDWTLLVQGVNLHSPAADALMRRFSFLSYTRLDDVMVSYAAPGGGVGPHFDSYDVFLLQGFGRRRWRYGRQDDLTLMPGLPLKILARFTPQEEHVVASGDMLYLPPQHAHDGVALEACTTYSIGLRAPSFTELAVAFCDFLRDEIDLPGRYADPDLTPTRRPARIAATAQRRCARKLAAIRWDRSTVDRFVGCWLSEPKPSVFFERPERPLSVRAFTAQAAKRGVRLSLPTQLLYDAHHLFINGSALQWPRQGRASLQRLADSRALNAGHVAALPQAIMTMLYDWYRDGFLDTAGR